MYRAFDLVRVEEGQVYAGREAPDPFDVPPSFFEALLTGDAEEFAPCLRNQLEAGSFRLRPDLEDTIERGVQAGALAGIVSGSGPTIALLCADAESADRVADRMRARGHVAAPRLRPRARRPRGWA